MLNGNLTSLPTLQQLYNNLSAIPVLLQAGTQTTPAGRTFVAFDAKHAFDLKSAPPSSSMGLASFVGGNFLTSGVISGQAIGGVTEPPFLWTTIQGDNLFAIKTMRETTADGLVVLTTTINSGSEEDLLRPAAQVDLEANETKIRQSFLPLGKGLESAALESEILSTGFSKTGRSIPAYLQPNLLAGSFQRMYATADFTKNLPNDFTIATIGEQGVAAFWDSWGEGIKAALTVGGGVVGGVLGGVAAGASTAGIGLAPGVISGAAGGSALGRALGDALT